MVEWNPNTALRDHLQHMRHYNRLGATSAGMAREIASTLSSRLGELSRQDLVSLATLARSGVDRNVWAACLHWYCARVDLLYFSFVTEWLFPAYEDGVYEVRSADVVPIVQKTYLAEAGKSLTEHRTTRAARDLLRMAAEFGLLSGFGVRRFEPYCLPDEAFLFLLHTMAEMKMRVNTIIDSADWRIFLMDSDDVERELLRLHQYRELHYEVAGTLRQLQLPCETAIAYVRRLGA